MVTFDGFVGCVNGSAENAFPADPGAREWLLKRNCALSPRQVLRAYLSLLALSVLIAGGFAALGAWMIVPFAGLEMLALAVALFIYARHATDHERVVLERGRLQVEAVVSGRRTVTLLNPHWARVEMDGRHRLMKGVVLLERDRCIAVGRYVSEQQCKRFAQELKCALSSAWTS